MKVSAWFMVVLAVVLGIYAYKLSKEATVPPEPRTVTQTVEAPAAPFQAIIAVQPIEPDRPIPDGAVSLEPVWVQPAGGFDRIDALAGRIPRQPIAVGEPVQEKHFLVGSVMSQKLEPGTRAVAVPITEETGVGGFPQPGDHVDVLLFLPDDNENENTQARILLKRVPVLAMGTQVDGQQSESKPNQGARTAVLAVPEDKALAVTLGASAGRIRLLLHAADQPPVVALGGESSAAEGASAAEEAETAAVEPTATKQAVPAAKEQTPPEPPEVLTLKQFAEVPKEAKTASSKPASAPRVVVYRGTEREIVRVR